MNVEKIKVLKTIDSSREQIIRRTQELIKYPSVFGNEKNAQIYYSNLLKELSFNIDMWEPTNEQTRINPHFLSSRDNYEGSPNVVGVLKGKGGGKSIILNGHIDVVPEGDNDWTDSPWSGKLKNNRIYGRGSSDMKGGLIANLMAVKAIIDSDIKLKGDVIIESVIGEETGGAGTLAALSRGYEADAAIVPEPTDLKICPVSMGAMWFKIKIKGKSAHAATSNLGVNAISKASKIIQKLNEFDKIRAKSEKHELYEHMEVPFAINIGKIKGGVFPTTVPDSVIIEGRMGISPNEKIAEARKSFENAVHEVIYDDSWLEKNPPQIDWFGFCISPGGIERNHSLVQIMTENYKNIKKNRPDVQGTPWGTDAGSLNRYGNIPTVTFGPGPGERAHKANEYIEIDKLINTTKIIASTVLDWCGYDK